MWNKDILQFDQIALGELKPVVGPHGSRKGEDYWNTRPRAMNGVKRALRVHTAF